MEKGKIIIIIQTDSQVIWNGSALAGLGSCHGLQAMGPCGCRSRPWGPAEHHLRAVGDRAPGCPHSVSSLIPTLGNNHFGEENLSLWGLHSFACQGWAGGERLLCPPLRASDLAPSTCSDSEKEVTGTCRQEPLTYIKKVYSRESVYISINISCIYINKYIKKKECIILMQHKAVLRVSKYEHCNLGYTDLGKRKDFVCFISSQFCFKNCTLTCIFVKLFIDINISVHWFK